MEQNQTHLTTREAAKQLRVSDQTLRTWRCKGVGPVFVKLRGRVLYDVRDLAAFLDRQRRVSTSDDGSSLAAAG